MVRRVLCFLGAVVVLAAPVSAQFTETITGFETDREGNALVFQPSSYGDLRVVMFQDPAEADVTEANIVSDTSPLADTSGFLPATEESFVANFTGDGFPGAGGSNQSLDIRFQWANTNGTRWALIETFQSPLLGDPSVHLDGEVRMSINFPLVTAEFPALNYTDRIGLALLIRETGNNVPQGFRDGGEGALEFVGVSSVAGADTADPVPVPSLYINGPTGGDPFGWTQVTFDLSTANVVGWTAEGGNGVLDATTNGDGVNRGVLAGLVITVDPTDAGAGASNYVELLVDNVQFESPVVDPTYPPSVASPLSEGQAVVRVKDVLSGASNVSLEIDRVPTSAPFVADETYNVNPAGALYVDFAVPTLNIGDRLRARQTNPSGVSGYSLELEVNPPAAFTFTVAIDEDGNNGLAPADFEFVGAASKISGAPQGKPVFAETGNWQNVEFSLLPGDEPVVDFAGGNGQLQPDGGSYNIDSIWFSIDPTVPDVGPYEVFVDHVYYIDEDDNEVLVSGAEGANPFALFRGQTTSTNGVSAVSTAASFDGTRSTRITWSWDNQSTSNTVSLYRPGVAFPDSAKAVGFWLYVPEVSTNGVPAPTVAGPIIGDVDGVVVNFTTTGVTSAELFLNGASVGVINTTGVNSVTFDTSAVVSAVGDQFAATQTTADGTSDLSTPRGVSLPAAPAVVAPVQTTDSTVTVNNLLTTAFSTASAVSVFDTNGVLLGTTAPAGASADVPLTIFPSAGDQVYATQTVNGLESPASPAITVVEPSGACVVSWSENFDTNVTANWTVNAGPTDNVADFFFDYSAAGIPPAPNSDGTTRGLKLQTNLTSGIFGGFSVSPTGQSFTGEYKLVCDWWGNFNGPFPGGGSGSTNVSGFGILTSGTTANYAGAADGVWFGATADGGSSADYRAYSPAKVTSYLDGDPVYAASTRNNNNPYYAQFGAVEAPAAQLNLYPNQTGTTQVGAAGMEWHQVEITKSGNFVTWKIDGLLLATVDITGMTLGGNNILFAASDINATSSADANAPAMLFTLIDNVRILVPQEQPVSPGDWDGDGDSDLDDYAEFAKCLGGPGSEPTPPIGDCASSCLDTFDQDSDADVDLRDFQALTEAGLFGI